MERGLAGFENLGIKEGFNYNFAGKISEILEDRDQANSYFKQGISITEKFPLYLASLNFEYGRTLVEISEENFAKEYLSKQVRFID